MNRTVLIAGLFVVLANLATLIPCSAQEPPVNLTISKDQWREDVRYFAAELEKRHKNLFHSVSKEDFQHDIDALMKDLPSLEPHQIVVRMQQITAKVGDGHTGVHLPLSFHVYPLGVFWFGEELRVIRTPSEYKDALGTRIVKIGDQEIAEVKKRLHSVISNGENEWHFLNTSQSFIVRPELLHALGIVPELDHAPFTFEDDAGKRTTLDIAAVTLDPKRSASALTAAAEIPLFRQRMNEPFWFTFLPESNTVYCNFKSYTNLATDSQKLFEFVDANPTKKLVVDMRQNDGGDFTKGRRYIIQEIKKRPELNKKGSLFVLIGRRTFSAAMVNATDFKHDTNAILVGEPIGERPNSYSENDELTLPNSKIVVSYSTRYYKFSDEDVEAVFPDQRIDPTWDDFKAGRDSVMDWVLAYKP